MNETFQNGENRIITFFLYSEKHYLKLSKVTQYNKKRMNLIVDSEKRTTFVPG